MKAVVTGGAGFLGSRLCRRLLDADGSGMLPRFERIVVFDTVEPPPQRNERLTAVIGDVGDAEAVRGLIDDDTASVFHLAAVVGDGAEADFDLGYHVNRSGMRNVLEACRAAPHAPRVVFASSIAVYGGQAAVDDCTPTRPLTSYGTQKVIAELLLNDYTRKGFVDGRAVRLPTVVVRPGGPTPAASTVASSIIGEPLAGRMVACPVPAATPLPLLSVSRAVDALLRVHQLDGAELGDDRSLLLGGICATAGEVVEAVGRVAGPAVAARVSWATDPAIESVVDGWPRRLNAERAARLGFTTDGSVDEIIRRFIADELGGVIAA